MIWAVFGDFFNSELKLEKRLMLGPFASREQAVKNYDFSKFPEKPGRITIAYNAKELANVT